MNLLSMKNYLIERARNNSSARLINFVAIINAGMRMCVNERDIKSLIISRILSTVSGQWNGYVVNDTEIDFIKKAFIHEENQPIDIVPVEILEERFPDPDVLTPGATSMLAVERVVPVLTQPTSASVVTVVSSSASDATPLTVTVTGLVSSVRQQETITLTGITSAAGTKSFTEIFSIQKSGVAVGKITCTSNAGVVTLCNISPSALGSRYLMIRVNPTPAGVYDITLKCQRILYDMVNDTDVPGDVQDEEFHNLVLGTAEMIIMKDPLMKQVTDRANVDKQAMRMNPGFRTLDRREYRTSFETGKRYQ